MDFIREKTALLRSGGDEAAASEYEALGELFERKLWHELTNKVTEVVRALSSVNHLDLLDSFLCKFEGRMNQLRYAEVLCLIVTGACMGGFLGASEGVDRLEKAVEDKKSRLGVEAALYVDMEAAMLTMEAGVMTVVKRKKVSVKKKKTKEADDAAMTDEAGKAEEKEAGAPAAVPMEEEEEMVEEIVEEECEGMQSVKEKLEAARAVMDGLSGTTETLVFEKFYRVAAGYYKRLGPPEAFYRSALSLLSYASVDGEVSEERYVLASDMSLAALTGDVYNFGEVLATPVLGALQNTPKAWLGELLRIFHAGDVDAFAKHVDAHRANIADEPALTQNFDFLKEKIAILALMNLLFETPSHERTLPFSAVARKTQLPLDQVEWLAMRAMALGLVRGTIDQVQETIHFEWVQPRVLDHNQIKHLVQQLDTLSDKSKSALDLLSDHTIDLL